MRRRAGRRVRSLGDLLRGGLGHALALLNARLGCRLSCRLCGRLDCRLGGGWSSGRGRCRCSRFGLLSNRGASLGLRCGRSGGLLLLGRGRRGLRRRRRRLPARGKGVLGKRLRVRGKGEAAYQKSQGKGMSRHDKGGRARLRRVPRQALVKNAPSGRGQLQYLAHLRHSRLGQAAAPCCTNTKKGGTRRPLPFSRQVLKPTLADYQL